MAEPKHHNRRGVVQGGMLMTFADRSMGMTCWYANERQPQATVQLDMHFVDAVQVGEFVEAKCKVVRRTRSLIFMSGRTRGRRARRRDRQRRVEDAGEAVVGLKGRFRERRSVRSLRRGRSRANGNASQGGTIIAGP